MLDESSNSRTIFVSEKTGTARKNTLVDFSISCIIAPAGHGPMLGHKRAFVGGTENCVENYEVGEKFSLFQQTSIHIAKSILPPDFSLSVDFHH